MIDRVVKVHDASRNPASASFRFCHRIREAAPWNLGHSFIFRDVEQDETGLPANARSGIHSRTHTAGERREDALLLEQITITFQLSVDWYSSRDTRGGSLSH